MFQLVKCIYFCHELKMKQKLSVTYMMTDLFVKKINTKINKVTVQEMSPLRFAPVDMTGTPK